MMQMALFAMLFAWQHADQKKIVGVFRRAEGRLPILPV